MSLKSRELVSPSNIAGSGFSVFFWFSSFGFFFFFSSQYFTNFCLFYYIGMLRKNWMISDLILPPEKVSRMFPSIKSDCLKYLQQCLKRIILTLSPPFRRKKKELGLCDLTPTCMVSLLGRTSMWLSVHLETNWNWLRRNSAECLELLFTLFNSI